MAGKKLGPRPNDFDEVSIRNSPTFQKWLTLSPGKELLYASRSFIRGGGADGDDDEERLMRRIMIRRRANLREHDCLKLARKQVIKATTASSAAATSSSSGNEQSSNNNKEEEEEIMDMEAVTSTRSYRRWASLPHGTSFVYNHTYIKGKDGQDWLLRKNIWRRMKYRRMNQCKVSKLKQQQQQQQQPQRERKNQKRRRSDDTVEENFHEKGASRAAMEEEDAAAANFDQQGLMIDANVVVPVLAAELGVPLLPPIPGHNEHVRIAGIGGSEAVNRR